VDKLIEAIQRAPQPSVCKHAVQARHRQQHQQHQYEDRENNLDQSKPSGTSHGQNYSLQNKSQHGQADRAVESANQHTDTF
jgi:hypothetical protein